LLIWTTTAGPDLFIASGHVYPQVDNVSGGAGYREPLVLFRNHSAMPHLRMCAFSSREHTHEIEAGCGFGDINNDGNVRCVIFNVGEPRPCC